MSKHELSLETQIRVNLLFPPPDQDEAASLLSGCATYLHFRPSSEIERIHFAALKIGNGDMHNMRVAIELGNIDFRDLLSQAEFDDPHEHEKWLPEKRW